MLPDNRGGPTHFDVEYDVVLFALLSGPVLPGEYS
jgi:hypothetical protein